MNLIKRLTTSVSATIDNAVGQLENHDAIVNATIKQTRQAVAKTRARINTLGQQKQAYESQLSEAQEQMLIWADRAKSLAKTDQAKALQCVSRHNQYKMETERLTLSVEQQRGLIHDVTANLNKLQNKLEEMTHKHDLMRSRQTVADVNRAVSNVSIDDNLNDTFERWESVVLEHELAVSDVFVRDALEDELGQQESEAELLAQLTELTHASEAASDKSQERENE